VAAAPTTVNTTNTVKIGVEVISTVTSVIKKEIEIEAKKTAKFRKIEFGLPSSKISNS